MELFFFGSERSDAGEERERRKRRGESLIREGELFGFTLISTVGCGSVFSIYSATPPPPPKQTHSRSLC